MPHTKDTRIITSSFPHTTHKIRVSHRRNTDIHARIRKMTQITTTVITDESETGVIGTKDRVMARSLSCCRGRYMMAGMIYAIVTKKCRIRCPEPCNDIQPKVRVVIYRAS